MTNALWHIDHCDFALLRVVDIGAHVGVFTKEAVKHGAFDVYAFEPNPQNFLELLENTNDIPEVHAFNIGIVRTAFNKQYCVRGDGATSSLACMEKGKPIYQTRVLEFNDLVKLLTPIDFLKVDIEGMEHEIFQPSQELHDILRHVGFLQLEIHKTSNLWGGGWSSDGEYLGRAAKIIDFLYECGFQDEPCEIRRQHPGDFCSHNVRYTGI